MFPLALRSLRHRAGAFTASFVTMFLGAAILMSFASMLDTAGGEGVDATGRETLTTMGAVVGGWGLLLVVFAVTSTLTLAVRRRAEEIALLKSVGATPAQIGRLIVGEALVLALAAAVAAIPLGLIGGRFLLSRLKDTGQVPEAVSAAFGAAALAVGFGVTLTASVLAAILTTRRATHATTASATADVDTDTDAVRPGRVRGITGWAALTAGLALAVFTATAMHGKGSDAMLPAVYASILVSIAFAMFAPRLLRWITVPAAWFLERRGAAGHLVLADLRRRAGRRAAVMAPIILFVGIGTGTLYLQKIENAALTAEGILKTNEQRNIETLNFVVIGMIVAFACVLLVNTLVASISHRRAEFARARLAGATPRGILAVVGLETSVLAVGGLALGTLASLATILPFSHARTGALLPDVTSGLWAAAAAVAVGVALAAAAGTALRVLRAPAIEALNG